MCGHAHEEVPMARTTDQVAAMLAKADLFSGLTAKDLGIIREQGKEMSFDEGDEITVEGRQAGRFFLILEGEVSISVHGRARPGLRAGDCFGEISLIDGGPRSATATATTPVRAWSLASFNFRPILRSHPTIAENVMLLLCRRLRASEDTADVGPA
jgi:CRP-like cAMP-binding protein